MGLRPDFPRAGSWENSPQLSSKQTEFAKLLRIPLLTTDSPTLPFLTGIVVESSYLRVALPTDEEITGLSASLERYKLRFYNPSTIERMREFAPYDFDFGANYGYFYKRTNGGWSYRKRTWTQSGWYPHSLDDVQDLPQVLSTLGW